MELGSDDDADLDKLQEILDALELARVDSEAKAAFYRHLHSEALKKAEWISARTGRPLRPSSDFSIKAQRSITNEFAAGRVRKYMLENGLTQANFASKTKVGERTLHRLLKSGTASSAIWAELARAVGTTFEDLISSKGE